MFSVLFLVVLGGSCVGVRFLTNLLPLVDGERGGAREHGNKHTDDCNHAEELVTLLLAARLMQPPSAAAAAKSCG